MLSGHLDSNDVGTYQSNFPFADLANAWRKLLLPEIGGSRIPSSRDRRIGVCPLDSVGWQSPDADPLRISENWYRGAVNHFGIFAAQKQNHARDFFRLRPLR